VTLCNRTHYLGYPARPNGQESSSNQRL